VYRLLLALLFRSSSLPQGFHLVVLDAGDLDCTSSPEGTDHGAEHELEDWLLAGGIGHDFTFCREIKV